MKEELKKIMKNLLLANNLEKVSINKNDIINYFDKLDDKVLSATIKPIIENEYQTIIEKLETDFDSNFEQERLKLVSFLTSLNLIIS